MTEKAFNGAGVAVAGAEGASLLGTKVVVVPDVVGNSVVGGTVFFLQAFSETVWWWLVLRELA